MDDIDVLIVGAGLSGIGLARELKDRMPQLRFEVFEARGATGGTWDLFRYPGIRSDSDLYTFGYRSRPWRHEKAIAGGDVILDYLRDAAAAGGIVDRIHLHHRVISADWSATAARWTVQVERADTGERFEVSTRWVFSAAGYYRYDRGFTPTLPGIDGFSGEVVHPQFWPESLDVQGRDVVVVGSGATAVTLVPALAEQGARVTMLQRTPSYILYSPSTDKLALRLRRAFGDRLGHSIARAKNIARQRLIWLFARRFPDRARRFIRSTIVRQLGEDYPVDVHFNPPYNPWDQRLCLVPDGDFFTAIRRKTASVVTDRIAGFSANAVLLESGEQIEADILVTATGLEVLPFGGISLSLDGVPVVMTDHLAYKGIMLDGIPNFGFAIGYTNASWTLKVELLSRYFVRLLEHMRRKGVDVCTPDREQDMDTRPLLDFDAGYVKRVISVLPRQGTRRPWRMSMNYYADERNLRWAPVRDRRLRFRRAASSDGAPSAPTAARIDVRG